MLTQLRVEVNVTYDQNLLHEIQSQEQNETRELGFTGATRPKFDFKTKEVTTRRTFDIDLL